QYYFFSSRRRHTRSKRDWSSDVCSSDLAWKDLSYSGAVVPMFAQVLELLGRFQDLGLLLEFKGTWPEGPASDLLAALTASAVADRTIVQSFDIDTVRVLRDLAPTVRCAGLARSGDAETIAICTDLGLMACNPHHRSVIEDPASVQGKR